MQEAENITNSRKRLSPNVYGTNQIRHMIKFNTARKQNAKLNCGKTIYGKRSVKIFTYVNQIRAQNV